MWVQWAKRCTAATASVPQRRARRRQQQQYGVGAHVGVFWTLAQWCRFWAVLILHNKAPSGSANVYCWYEPYSSDCNCVCSSCSVVVGCPHVLEEAGGGSVCQTLGSSVQVRELLCSKRIACNLIFMESACTGFWKFFIFADRRCIL